MRRLKQLLASAVILLSLPAVSGAFFNPTASCVSAGAYFHFGQFGSAIYPEPAVTFKYHDGQMAWVVGVSGFYGGVQPAEYESGGKNYVSGLYRQWALYEDAAGRISDVSISHFRICPFAGAVWNSFNIAGKKQYIEFIIGLPAEGENFRYRDNAENSEKEFSVFKAVSIFSPYAGVSSELFDVGDATIRVYAGYGASFLGIGGAALASYARAGFEAEFRQYRYEPVKVPQEEPKEEGGMIWSEDGKEEVIDKK